MCPTAGVGTTPRAPGRAWKGWGAGGPHGQLATILHQCPQQRTGLVSPGSWLFKLWFGPHRELVLESGHLVWEMGW